jgi:hypoxanthine phosphoribosyltransferase
MTGAIDLQSVIVYLGAFGTVVGIAGLIYSVRTEQINRRLRVEKFRFAWNDVEKAAREIGRLCLQRFDADAVVTFSGPGAIIANLAMIFSGKMIPLYTVLDLRTLSTNKPARPGEPIALEGYFEIKTSRRRLMIPQTLKANAHDRIAVIDDCVITGEAIEKVVEFLVTECRYARERIKVAAAVAPKSIYEQPIASRKPNIVWMTVANDSYHFPWRERF